MPSLVPTDYSAEIVWLGIIPDRAAGLQAAQRETLTLGFDGAQGEAHGGITRPSCSRVTAQHKRGTEIANTRQLCVMSAEELDATAEALGMESLDPRFSGANLVLRGIPDFTHVPPSARLQGPDGATIVIDMENRPCHLPAREIEAEMPGAGKGYKSAAKGRRGVTAWVERPGLLRLGERMRLHIPDQRGWQPER